MVNKSGQIYRWKPSNHIHIKYHKIPHEPKPKADAGMDYPKIYDLVKDLNPTGLKCLLMKLSSTQGENLVVLILSY